MIVEYIYCPHCGYEDFDVFIEFSATYGVDSFWFCPKCRNETSHVEH